MIGCIRPAQPLSQAPQAWSRVDGTFNTTFAPTLVAGQVAGQPFKVFITGDDAHAKASRSAGSSKLAAGACLTPDRSAVLTSLILQL